MRLSKLIEKICVEEIAFEEKKWDREISTITANSDEVVGESLYVCLTGGRTDGHAYAPLAVKNGAVAIVAERKLNLPVPQIIVKDTRTAISNLASIFYGEPSERLKIIAVTGTNGKTTTSHMLAAALRAGEKKVGIIGTLGIFYDNKQYPCPLTTPDPIFLQKTLAEMFLRGVEYVVMEVSAHALHYNKTASIRYRACIFTNLSQDHLDFFLTMKCYEQAKSKLFSTNVAPIAILNGDDATGRKFGLKREKEKGKTLYYGLTTPADSFAVITDETLGKTECIFNINDEIARVSLAFTGRYNVYNALAAATCAVELGIPLLDVAKGISALQGVEGRLEHVATYNGAQIFVDFAHTPDGLEKSLTALRLHCKERLICLFGCGGNRDKTKRPIMGATVAKKCDFAILTSDNPRYEDPLDIIGAIEKGYRRFSMKYVVVPERESGISYAIEHLKKGDVLLVAGKGGEDYQEIMGIKYSFNDKDIIKNTIKNKSDKPLL